MGYKMDNSSQPIPGNSGSQDKIFNSKSKIAYNLEATYSMAVLSMTLGTPAVLDRIYNYLVNHQSQPQPTEQTNGNSDQSFTYRLKAANTLAVLSLTGLAIVAVLYCIHSHGGSTRSQPQPPEHTNSNPHQLNNPNQVFTYKPMIDYSPRAANTITCLQPNSQLNSNTDKTNSIPKQINSPIQNFDYNPEIKYNPTAANTMTDWGVVVAYPREGSVEEAVGF